MRLLILVIHKHALILVNAGVSNSQLVKDMIMRKRKEVFGHNQPEIMPQIYTLILIDRNIDLMTPLSTQLTYEGLIDEIYGIKNCKTRIVFWWLSTWYNCCY